ncbi:adenosylmethionine-8-amino-7-oxononanoate aminotransferase [Hyphomicrobium denitrificans ATCC 51888]|uniref:Adenosylmethionine-8-amino-7-oxononanoate aminotransferase n=1 Tax=Hyphomicrobium denitrificans (strain ATCC 51888 / DSM 1869 / NCIMB 11706 / TK 0415) TaxID=582899 RepID=D8JWN3_HYPDA|nr:adenosylmethionine--8-amino-7-oxononanoate transaminase [Hyphomicrobium denitrificans]ADJ24991.1 adenosylmethionine-8-amino-7-oxononanoate aminotransferase [Hyphomicrobium denitrificans ATCC 51888]
MSRSPVWHPFTQHGLEPNMLAIARADGAWLETADGRRIFDGVSSWWVITHGHGHPKIVRAIQEQAGKLDQVIFAGFTHEPAEAVARGLVELAPPGLAHIFFSDSGSTSVEVALKMALGYWKNIGKPRTRILALEHAYHGDTIGTMSAGARGVFNAAYEPLLFDVGRIPFPAAGAEQTTFDALERACRAGDVAAFICEPLILGAGGMLIYDAETLAEMHRICKRHDVLFIADEVMTAFGRTGTLFASEQAKIAPDIICVAKGITGGSIPLAATLCTEAIFDAHCSQDRSRMFFHSSSYTANPIACAAAAANLDIWRSEPVLSRIDAVSKAQAACLAQIANDPRFEKARQIGTIAAFELRGASTGYLADVALSLRRKLLDRNVLLRPLGATIYIMPPYCATADDLNGVYAAISEVAVEVRR